METQRLYGRQIAYGAVGDVSHALQSQCNASVNLAHERPHPGI